MESMLSNPDVKLDPSDKQEYFNKNMFDIVMHLSCSELSLKEVLEKSIPDLYLILKNDQNISYIMMRYVNSLNDEEKKEVMIGLLRESPTKEMQDTIAQFMTNPQITNELRFILCCTTYIKFYMLPKVVEIFIKDPDILDKIGAHQASS